MGAADASDFFTRNNVVLPSVDDRILVEQRLIVPLVDLFVFDAIDELIGKLRLCDPDRYGRKLVRVIQRGIADFRASEISSRVRRDSRIGGEVFSIRFSIISTRFGSG